MANIKPVIEESFKQYAGAVLQSRALVDVRDCLKPSARQIFYSMHNQKLTHDKPFKKTNNAVGLAMADYYIHGDASCEGVIMRAAQPFAMRYPLVDVEGSFGSLLESGNWAAPRYTASRLSKLSSKLFEDVKKDTITEWRDNYDDTKQYPAVLPSKGYYNLCNGTFGIGIGAGSSIPQFNLRELNSVLIKLLENPNINDKELIIMPDFATGAILLNPTEVKESLIKGGGKSCKLRSVINYDKKDNCLVVTEIPYGVYTNTICEELREIVEGEENPGISRYNDLTGETPEIKIYLNRNIDPNKVLKFLYKNTSLQYWYAINFTMLDNGRYPKQFTWKETLQAHINHEIEVYTRGFEYDREVARKRLHIVEGLLIALASIEEVVQTIKGSDSTAAAKIALTKNFVLTEIQADAILDMKLSRLAHLEVNKLEKERDELNAEIDRLTAILTNPTKLNNCIISGWRDVMIKYGDARRTQIASNEITDETEDGEHIEIEEKPIINLVTESNNILPVVYEDKINLTKKGSPFIKEKVAFGYVTSTTAENYLVDSQAKMYCIKNRNLDILSLNPLSVENRPVCVVPALDKEYLITVTNKGIVKKSALTEYKNSKRASAIAKIRDGEELLFAGCANNTDYLLLLGASGGLVKIAVSSLTSSGKNTIGVKGIDDVGCISATIASESDLIMTIADGKGKYTKCSDFNITGKGSKGQKITDNTTTIAKVTNDVYIVESQTKISKYEGSAPKGKTAVGAKISTSQILQIVC